MTAWARPQDPPEAFRLAFTGTDDDGGKCGFDYACLLSDPGVPGSGAGFAAGPATWVRDP